jgi:hypothetical protein
VPSRTELICIRPSTRELIKDLRESQFLGQTDEMILRSVLFEFLGRLDPEDDDPERRAPSG